MPPNAISSLINAGASPIPAAISRSCASIDARSPLIKSAFATFQLADPAEGRGGQDQNATVERLLNDVLNLDRTFDSTLTPLFDKFRAASQPLHDLRNKIIAHLDLPTATKTVPPPAVATVLEVRAALAALAEFMNAIAVHFGETPTAYEAVGMMGAGPTDLLGLLKSADRYLEAQKAGKVSWDDHPEIVQ